MEHVSAANAQLVQVARALAFDCRVLVLDEPTTSLTDAEVDHLFRILAELKARGVTILFVSHRLPEVFRLCDRITVLRDGSHAGTFVTSDDDADAIVRAMVGREPPVRLSRPAVDASATPVLSVRNLSRGDKFRDVSLDVRPGEIVGSVRPGRLGPHRAARDAVRDCAAHRRARCISEGGQIVLRSAREASRAGIALVPEDRQRLGLHFNLNHPAQPVAGRGRAHGLRPHRHARGDARRAKRWRGAWRCACRRSRHEPDALSGGNQQKMRGGEVARHRRPRAAPR